MRRLMIVLFAGIVLAMCTPQAEACRWYPGKRVVRLIKNRHPLRRIVRGARVVLPPYRCTAYQY